jgi:hypothetical protein
MHAAVLFLFHRDFFFRAEAHLEVDIANGGVCSLHTPSTQMAQFVTR